ncbi:MAG: RDD family protein [Solirubrobacteraceae bacterium]
MTPQTPPHIGVVTRGISWTIDAVLLNLVAIITGLGALLVISVFPVAKGDMTVLKVIGGVVYVLWFISYFVVFWSTTGQTPGARVMQIRLITPGRPRVKPARALVRWVGMQLAAIPLFAGYVPILFGRRGFPDWLARTAVAQAPQLSLAQVGQAALRGARSGTPAAAGAAAVGDAARGAAAVGGPEDPAR